MSLLRHSASRTIAAPAEKIFDLLADPEMHPVLDGSGSVKASRDGNPKRLSLGAKFGMDMRAGAPYRVRNTVVEFEEGRRIGWRHFARHVWRYELEPADGSTKVTETVDFSRAWISMPLGLLLRWAYPRMLEATLDRIEQAVLNSQPTA